MTQTIEIQVVKSDKLHELENRHSNLNDAATNARAILRTTYSDLLRETGIEFSVNICDARYPEANGRELSEMETWLEQHNDATMATDSNLFLLAIQQDDEDIMGRAELGGDVAKVVAGNMVAAYDVDYWRHNDLSYDATDVDNDGIFEDPTGNGSVGILDVQTFFSKRSKYANHRHSRLFDFNNDGSITISDVQKLFALSDRNISDEAVPIPFEAPITPFPAPVGIAMSTVPHEVGHNLGFEHKMGSMRREERNGSEVVVVSTMVTGYYQEFGNETGYFGQEYPPVSDGSDEVVFEFIFGDKLRENVTDVIEIQ